MDLIRRDKRAFSFFIVFALGVFSFPQGTLGASHAHGKDVGPKFKDGQAQIVPEFNDKSKWIRHDLWVETEFDSDGDNRPDRVHVSVTRQAQTESQGLKVPVVYVSSPYFSGTASSSRRYFWNPNQELGTEPPKRTYPPGIPFNPRRPSMSQSHVGDWVPRGFAVVHSASPGTGLSQGCPTVGGDNESLAPKAVIDWLNGRARGFKDIEGEEEVEAFWSTGKVGMTGTSYNGTIPLAAATTGVEGLEAIIPIAPNTSYYHYYRSNGLIRHPGGWMGEDIDVLFDFISSGNPKTREYCACEVRDKVLMTEFDRVDGDYNDFWAGRDYLNDLGPLKAPTLMAHAFNDWNVMPEHGIRIYQAITQKGVPTQLFMHQGGHGGPPPMRLMNRWFTRFLYGIDNGVEKDPKVWIVREGEKRTNPTPYAAYPHPKSQPVDLAFLKEGNHEGALIVATQIDHGPNPLQTLVDDASIAPSKLAAAKSSPHRLLYDLGTLGKPLHISGIPRIKLRLAASRQAANLSVWLVSLPWQRGGPITDNIITRGWADPQNSESITEGKPLVPGQFYDVEFDLQPEDQIIPAGQSIALMVFSSDREFTLWPEAGTELTLDLSRSWLRLPILGGADALLESLDH